MSGTVTAEELASFPLFHGLPAADLVLLAASAERRELADGAVIYGEGVPISEVYLLEHGQVMLRIMRDGHPLLVGTLRAEPFGWSALREEPLALTTARASGEVTLVAIEAVRILDLICSGTPAGRTLVQRVLDVAALNLASSREQMVRRGREGVITGG